MEKMQTFRAVPDAAILMESMRDIGYSLETALADIIDNSLTANASEIDIYTSLGDRPRIAIIDNGKGMSHDELLVAMRPGSWNPLGVRPPKDLGRFGLGLKTASFSQCRRLTVVTRHLGETHAAVWDLHFVAAQNDWLVQIPENVADIPWVNHLGVTGTLVLWEDLDRLLEQQDGQFVAEHFVGRLNEARGHLELVFHRFLTGEPGLARIKIRLNNRPLEPLDPFHTAHPATVFSPLETIKVGDQSIYIRTFTLPHHRKVTSEQWERHAGRDGYQKNQGFYVYREKRLILFGTWFGLARQAELTKLARVQIDLPNGLDAEWKIDVKKASAEPPLAVRIRLKRIIETIGSTSRRVYTARGRSRVTDKRLPVWVRAQDKNQIRYLINREHPVVQGFFSSLPVEFPVNLTRVLELVESTLPMDMLFADIGGSADLMAPCPTSDEALKHAVAITASSLLAAGIKDAKLLEMLQCAEPFKSNWDRAKQFLLGLNQEGTTDVQQPQ